MEHPVELILNIPVELTPNEALLRGQHVMVIRVAGASGIKKPNFPLFHLI
jgi:hypothetical protein